ncbi:alpha-mannosidase [candidate division KSB1 bacterium]
MLKVFIVPHTHWDRAWYLPFQDYRMKLVEMIDYLVDILEKDPEYKSFMLDGQTILLEDYLAVKPYMKEKLKELVEKKRIFIGPWYVLADEFIVSGEALLRNLLIGRKVSKEFGEPLNAGYIPDSFGHIEQLPQILKGFGLPTVVFSRGMGDEAEQLGTEFVWKTPDGTEILALYQFRHYVNGANLGYGKVFSNVDPADFSFDKALKQIREEVDELSPHLRTNNVIIYNGFDHQFPQPELPEIIKKANKKFNDMTVIHGSIEEYQETVISDDPILESISGELTYGKNTSILQGVYSTRVYLKLFNDKIENTYEKYVEPISAFAWVNGSEYPYDFLIKGWKTLLKNHPHDDICGCGIDQIHREMQPRFQQSLQIANRLLRNSISDLGKGINTSSLKGDPFVIFNPHNWEITDVLRAKVRFKRTKPDNEFVYRIVDSEGNEVEYLKLKSDKRTVVDLNYFEDVVEDDIILKAKNIPPCGYRVFDIFEGEPEALETDLKLISDGAENKFLSLRIKKDGSLSILDKKTGKIFEGLNLFEDSEDAGDEYNYSPIKNSIKFYSNLSNVKMRLQSFNQLEAIFKVTSELAIPASLSMDRKSRSNKIVICPVTSYISLKSESRKIDIRTEVANKAKDHRIRVSFPANVSVQKAFAGGHFTVLERDIDIPVKKDWAESPSPTKNFHKFVDINNGKFGLCVAARGLREYEMVPHKNKHAIMITLLRSVGWLSRDDLMTRKGHAGPAIPTPEAQCLGDYHFHYSIIPHDGDLFESKSYQLAFQSCSPIITKNIDKSDGELPLDLSFVRVEPEELVVSTIKRAENDEALIVRFYNISNRKLKGKITFYKDLKKIENVDLKEDKIEELSINKGNSVNLYVPNKRIVTLKAWF